MHFDDRLATVLQHRAAGERAARVQFRQLLDLLGEPHGDADRGLTQAAYRRLDELAPMIPAAQRERLASDCSPRIRDPRLVAWFAGGEPRIAMAALSRAALDEDQWLALIPKLPIRARGLLRHRRNFQASVRQLLDRLGVHDRVLPEPAPADPEPGHASGDAAEGDGPALDLGRFEEQDYVLETGSVPAEAAEPGDLGALVRRIEAFQRAREQRTANAGTEPVPIAAFLFTTDEAGRIDWAEGDAAPLVIGTLIIGHDTVAGAAPGATGLATAFARRRPLTGAAHDLAGAPAIAGRWIVDAAPRFSSRGGGFGGYVGRFRRPSPAPVEAHALRAADRVRQLLHELRTPVTAIQGFAEVIQQQTVGPVAHEYRALAAGIAGDAARMLAGFAEIERLSRLEAGTQELPEGDSDFVAVARRQIAQLRTVLSPRVSRIEAIYSLESGIVPLAADMAETIAWRFLGTLAAATAAGETMSLTLTSRGNTLRLEARLPAALMQARDVFAADIHPAGGALATGLLGAGFALRLARAEARAAGGDLTSEATGVMVLTLPLGDTRAAPGGANRREGVPGLDPRAPAPLAQSPRPG